MNSEPRPTWLIGIDEVGRGPLAGPITVAAVAVPFMEPEAWNMKQAFFAGIRDSKKLTVLQRQSWNKKIRKEILYTISSVSCGVIDKRGISYAARVAVARCLKKLSKTCFMFHDSCYVILDGGLAAPLEYKNQQTIIKGDEKVPVIAAASIIAKVHRDRYMTRLYKKYPLYGFEKHKGYGTKMHTEAILKNGLSEIHRKSFCKNLHYINKVV